MQFRFRAICQLLLLTLLPFGTPAVAAEVLVYLSPLEYTHPIRLWQYFDDHWFKQGPVVEPIARAALSAAYGTATMCEAQSAGEPVVWIKPRMYYNPHTQTYYGKIEANVFDPEGEAVASHVGEAQRRGFLDVYPQRQLEAVYQAAMQNLMAAMDADTTLRVMVEKADGTSTVRVCEQVAALPPRQILDVDYFLKRAN